ncbi:MAG TPA: hypothetical protein VJ124_00035, partial [Pyrinomonadaceae bacterium]|nr:hypothetical protein [Pyrinomonadaceae bacterium]
MAAPFPGGRDMDEVGRPRSSPASAVLADVKGNPLFVVTAVPPDVPRWLASRVQLLLALGLRPPSRFLQFATEVGKSSPLVQ